MPRPPGGGWVAETCNQEEFLNSTLATFSHEELLTVCQEIMRHPDAPQNIQALYCTIVANILLQRFEKEAIGDEAMLERPKNEADAAEAGQASSHAIDAMGMFISGADDVGQSALVNPRGKGMVVALGVKEQHWREVKKAFPACVNCSIDVREAFHREWYENTKGSGFDQPTRDRMKAKETWGIVWEVALSVLREFDLLLVLCNHGKHRSLSLAYEVAEFTGCELVSIRERDRWYTPLRRVTDVMSQLTSRLAQHARMFGKHPHPIVGIQLCESEFDGHGWEDPNDPDSVYLKIAPGDILIQVFRGKEESQGWSFGSLVGTGEPSLPGWYPPSCVSRLPPRSYGIQCLFTSLVNSDELRRESRTW